MYMYNNCAHVGVVASIARHGISSGTVYGRKYIFYSIIIHPVHVFTRCNYTSVPHYEFCSVSVIQIYICPRVQLVGRYSVSQDHPW